MSSSYLTQENNQHLAKLNQKEIGMCKTYQSRWGFHPCSHEVFLKIKELHKWYYEELRRLANWRRWFRKEPQNRVICRKIRNEQRQVVGKEVVRERPEPTYCPHFYSKHGKPHEWRPIYEDSVLRLYQQARMPKTTPEEVEKIPQEQLDHLLELHAKVKQWYVYEKNGLKEVV